MSAHSGSPVQEKPAPLMLSVSGLRGLIGKSLTPLTATRFAASFGSWLKAQLPGQETIHVVLGRDSRPSGDMLESAAAAGLTSVGCKVTRLGIVTTPTVALMTRQLNADGGIVITASHNPIIWNGLKTLRADGCAPPKEQAQDIIDRFHSEDFSYAEVEDLKPIDINQDAHDRHIDLILEHIDVEAIKAKNFKVVLDSVNGAGCVPTARLLEKLGVKLIHLNGEPTGFFAHTPEPTKDNLTDLANTVREHGADLGLAQDPDADRLAMVDENGKYIGEEYTLVLCAKHLMTLKLASEASDFATAANLSTSRMIDDVVQSLSQKAGVRGEVIRTPVGEANVAKAIRDTPCLCGGEGNGGIIWPIISQVRDSLAGAALMLEMLAKNSSKVSEEVAAIPAYAIEKTKFPVSEEILAGLKESLLNSYASALSDGSVTSNTDDGVRLDWSDRWVHVRASNTEPIIRVIAEAPEPGAAKSLANEIAEKLGLNS